MDAKSRANFVNSVASGATIPCQNCGASNKAEAKFCISCGAELAAAQEASSAPAFAPVAEPAAEPAFAPAADPVAEPAFAPAADPVAEPAFAPAAEPVAEPAFAPAAEAVETDRYQEPISVFAQGLPAWNIEPPQIMVRRR